MCIIPKIRICVRVCVGGREKESWLKGCVGVKDDIKSLLMRLSTSALDPLPCGCLIPAAQGPGKSNMLSSRDMTSPRDPCSPSLPFGCNPFGLSQRDCYPTTRSNMPSAAAQTETFALMLTGQWSAFSLSWCVADSVKARHLLYIFRCFPMRGCLSWKIPKREGQKA